MKLNTLESSSKTLEFPPS